MVEATYVDGGEVGAAASCLVGRSASPSEVDPLSDLVTADPATPPSNTGVDTCPSSICQDSELSPNSLHEYRIDYLTLIIFDESENRKLLGEWLGWRIESEASKRYGGHTVHRSEHDPSMHVHEGERYWVWVFPGGARKLCEYPFWMRVAGLLSQSKFRVNCSRIDVTMDQVFSTVLPVRYPMDVYDHFVISTFSHNFRSHKFIRNQLGDLIRMRQNRGVPATVPEDWGNCGIPSDETFYIGSRTSPIFVRIYDQHGPLRWEWELKGNRSLPMLRALVGQMDQGYQLGEVVRGLWIGLAVEFLPCGWWGKLGLGEVVDPTPIPDTTLSGAIKASIDQYSSIYVAVADTGNHPRFLGLCRRRLAGTCRTNRYRAARLKQRIVDAGLELWEEVANMMRPVAIAIDAGAGPVE